MIKIAKRKYYGFKYYSGRETRWASTSRIAGSLVIFSSLALLDEWLADGRVAFCSGNGGERVRVTRKEAISLVGIRNFNNAFDFIIY